MAIMFGNGNVSDKATGTVSRTVMARAIDSTSGGTASAYIDYIFADLYNSATKSSERYKIDMKETTARSGMLSFAEAIASPTAAQNPGKGMVVTSVVSEQGTVLGASATEGTSMTLAEVNTAIAAQGGKKILITYTVPVSKSEIVVSANTFPGTYYVQGDTYARSDVDGSDQFFQFIIQKAKMTSENTITLEAEGDPAVFNMNLTVLRPEDGEMMKLVQYDLV